MVGLFRLAQLSPALSEGRSIRHVETSALVAGEASAQTAGVLEDATGLLEKGRPVLAAGSDCAYELNAAGGKAPGEPYEGKLHVRFDEGVLETELWSGMRHRQMAKAAGNRNPRSCGHRT